MTIESSEEPGAVEGVTILGVSPGSAASDAGLRSGDILTAVNDESLSAESRKEANMRLLDFMEAVEEGDVLTVEYLRDGKVGSVEIEPRIVDDHAFAWVGKGGSEFDMPSMQVAPEMVETLQDGIRISLGWQRSG